MIILVFIAYYIFAVATMVLYAYDKEDPFELTDCIFSCAIGIGWPAVAPILIAKHLNKKKT